jgi:flagellar biosynthesis/type III secretory pathway M-ring protein FliF/YscJ
MTIDEIINRSSHCVVTDGAGKVYSAIKVKVEDLRTIEAQIDELQRVKHLAWHVLESSEERGDEIVVARSDFEALVEVLPLEHPQGDDQPNDEAVGREHDYKHAYIPQ